MAEESVSLKLDADASGLRSEVRDSGDAMEELAGKSTQAGEEIEQSVSGASSAWEQHSDVINGAAVAVGAMGAAVEGLARSQQDTRAVAGRLANTLEGETTDSVMGLAAEIHNATTDLDELVVMMETGRQQGIESADQLQDYALFWDMVGDATGETAGSLADASVALRAVGIDAGNEAEALDAFGFIAEKTTGSVGEFLRFLERTGPELRDFNLDVDDAAAIMGALESELGMTGRTARQEFRSAVNESDGDLGKLLETLGLSTEQFESYRGEVSESSGVIEANAEAFADSRTAVQELTASFEAFLAQHSGLVEGLSALSPVLMGAGGAVFAFNQMRGAVSGIAPRLGQIAQNATGAESGLRGIGRAAGIAAAVWAADAALSALHSTMVDLVMDTPDVEDFTLALQGLGDTGDIPESVAGSFDHLGDALDRVDAGPVQGLADTINRAAAQIPGAGMMAPSLQHDVEMLEVAEAQVEAFDAAMAQAADAGNDAALAAGMETLADVTGLAGDELDEFIAENLPQYARALDNADISQGNAADGAGDLEEAIDDAGGAFDDAAASVDNYLDAVRAAEDPVFALDRALRGVEDAQQKYTDAVEEHGSTSAEAERASLDLMRALSDMEAAAIDGDLSFAEFEGRLARWVEQGAITEEQADNIRRRVDEAREAGEDFTGEYRADVIADTSQALSDLAHLNLTLEETVRARTLRVNAHVAVHGGGVAGGITERADGGPVWPGEPFLVGEEGPELVTFGERGHVHDAATTAELASAASGVRGGDGASQQVVNYHFHTDPSDEGFHSVRKHEQRQQAAQVAYG